MSVLPSFAERKRVWVFCRCTLSEITSVRRYRPVETEVDSRGQSAAKRDHLTSILGGAGTVGHWVESSQVWRPDNSGTSGPGPGSRGPDQSGGPVTSSEAGPWAGGEDRGYATVTPQSARDIRR